MRKQLAILAVLVVVSCVFARSAEAAVCGPSDYYELINMMNGQTPTPDSNGGIPDLISPWLMEHCSYNEFYDFQAHIRQYVNDHYEYCYFFCEPGTTPPGYWQVYWDGAWSWLSYKLAGC